MQPVAVDELLEQQRADRGSMANELPVELRVDALAQGIRVYQVLLTIREVYEKVDDKAEAARRRAE